SRPGTLTTPLGLQRADDEAAVYLEAGAGDVGGRNRGKEGHQRADLFGLTDTAEGHATSCLGNRLLEADAAPCCIRTTQFTLAVGEDDARQDIVDRDAGAPELARERLRQRDHRRAQCI